MNKKTKKTVKTPELQGATSEYVASIKVLGKVYRATGNSVSGAIQKLTPGVAKGTSVLSIEHDGKKIEKILPPMATARLFSPSPTVRLIHLKQVAMRFAL